MTLQSFIQFEYPDFKKTAQFNQYTCYRSRRGRIKSMRELDLCGHTNLLLP